VTRKLTPFLGTYIVLAVLAGLGAYAYFVDAKKEPGAEKKKEKVFQQLDKDKIKEVTLTPAEGEAIHLVKADGGWRMAAPLVVAADSQEVDSLLSSLQSLEIEDVVTESAPKLGDFGLSPAEFKVSVVSSASPQPLEVLLGQKAPMGSGLYAKVPSQPRIFTIASYLQASLEKKPFDLRDRDLLHVKRDAVKTLDIEGPKGAYSLVRGGGEEFSFTKPVVTKAGRWSVDGLLSSLEQLKMESIAAENVKDLKPFGLLAPTWKVQLGLNDGTSRTLEIGSSPADKKYNARESGASLVAVIPQAVVDDLGKGMEELRAKRLLDLATYEVDGFAVSAGGTAKEYQRSSTKAKDGFDVYKWKRTKPDAKDLETPKVEDLLFKLGGLEVKEFIDKPQGLPAYGLDQPILKVTVHLGAKPPVWAEIGEKDGAFFARRPGDDSILKLDSVKADEVVKSYKDF
jgi:hypothetical protein